MIQTLKNNFFSVVIAFLIAALVVPTLVFMPQAFAQEQSIEETSTTVETKATEVLEAKFSDKAEDANERALILDELSQRANAAAEEAKKKEADEEPSTTAPQETTPNTTDEVIEADSNTEIATEPEYIEVEPVAAVVSDNVLLATEKVDSTYTGCTISLDAANREVLAHLIMGEGGDQGFVGCCLVAQVVRDIMVTGNVYDMYTIIKDYGFYASLNNVPNQDVYDSISYVFDQGGSAVQHRIMAFYETAVCYSEWHETQNFIVSYNTTRFFDWL